MLQFLAAFLFSTPSFADMRIATGEYYIGTSCQVQVNRNEKKGIFEITAESLESKLRKPENVRAVIEHSMRYGAERTSIDLDISDGKLVSGISLCNRFLEKGQASLPAKYFMTATNKYWVYTARCGTFNTTYDVVLQLVVDRDSGKIAHLFQESYHVFGTAMGVPITRERRGALLCTGPAKFPNSEYVNSRAILLDRLSKAKLTDFASEQTITDAWNKRALRPQEHAVSPTTE